ncbi:multidrug and toxin extrusion protein 1-like [Seriola lalandi dorsalis]|uniref:multidrug and toxin extrusion protein 1-like n=1 Tax=Seriola lalandi dorsalis TaxID=1841481 RepID=UPI000C6F49F9|nr:multidrug and toxin extrusion protein 1-like [Seriola lalandi dorsalis]
MKSAVHITDEAVYFSAGFWLGLLVCVILQSTFYIIVIFKLNWERMTEEALKRAQKNTHMILLSTAALSDTAGNNTADRTAGNGNSVNGYISVRSECHDGNTETQDGHVVQQVKGGRLSTTQLILRRGLTMFLAVGLLAVGASVHFLAPFPQTFSSEANFTKAWINSTYTPDQILSTVLVPNEESA